MRYINSLAGHGQKFDVLQIMPCMKDLNTVRSLCCRHRERNVGYVQGQTCNWVFTHRQRSYPQCLTDGISRHTASTCLSFRLLDGCNQNTKADTNRTTTVLRRVAVCKGKILSRILYFKESRQAEDVREQVFEDVNWLLWGVTQCRLVDLPTFRYRQAT